MNFRRFSLRKTRSNPNPGAIVLNLDHILFAVEMGDGGAVLHLTNGEKITVSMSFASLAAFLIVYDA